jgi:hypothetical protein
MDAAFGLFLASLAVSTGLLVLTTDPLAAWLAGLDGRIWQAVVAGGFVALGWIVNGWQERRAQARSKAEKLRDYHKALFAEIRNAVDVFFADGESERDAQTILQRMEQDDDFVPFLPKENLDRVYLALMPEIEVLPRQTIDAIVAFYAQVASIEAFAADMRGTAFRTLPQARRILMYRDYIAMRNRAYLIGMFSLRLIDAYSRNGKAAAERVAVTLSNPDAGHPVRSAGSE